MKARAISNDCFALPPGVNWLPVDVAIGLLQKNLSPLTSIEQIVSWKAAGRILAEDIVAIRPNPPANNSAIDGYGFWLDRPSDQMTLPILPGYSAPGHPYNITVPVGFALKVLTGSQLPPGINTVVLDEMAIVENDHVTIPPVVNVGQNTRSKGEDFISNNILFPEGHRLQSNDIATLIASGQSSITVRKKLVVGIMSTGDELRSAGTLINDSEIIDMNRPMLLSMIEQWGYEPIDLECAPDDARIIRSCLDSASHKVDVILTSGGASASSQDHISRLLTTEGQLQFWRIAIKPGRPLALGNWNNTPVFGLPGNPIAAFVCALIFAYPAMQRMAGEPWSQPQGFNVPAAFDKSKKKGRREFLRARTNRDGHIEIFHSEGSGLTTGLAWSDGLVELADDVQSIGNGDLVRYIPYTSFRL